MSGFAKYISIVEDFYSDSLVLCLESASSVKDLMSLDSIDMVNQSLTVISLVFVKVQ